VHDREPSPAIGQLEVPDPVRETMLVPPRLTVA
jgi:hypothetical protein